MTNLLKNKSRTYRKELSEREIYETERYYLLKVVDISGCLEKELARSGWEEGVEAFIEKLFLAQKNSRLSSAMVELLDTNRVNIDYTTREMSKGTSIATIIISKKRMRERVKEYIEKVRYHIFDAQNTNEF